MTAPSKTAAARAFYRDVLRGRQVWPTERAGGGLWFFVAGTLVEAGADFAGDAPPVVLEVDDPYELAERCWDAGFSVQVHEDATDRAQLSVVDPFGRSITLAPRQATRRIKAGGGRR